MVPVPATLLPLSQLVLMASWGVFCDHLTEEEKSQAWFMQVLHNMQAPPESGNIPAPERKSSPWQKFNQCI